MLDKHTAVANIAIIIKQVKGALITREYFENAMYDLFEHEADIADLMLGYDYFALMVKKPKIDNAVNHIAKTANLPKEKIKEICEIWVEAKFAGKSEEDIAATVYFAANSLDNKSAAERFSTVSPEEFDNVEFIATDVSPKRRAKKPPKSLAGPNARNSQAAGSAPMSSPMRQSHVTSKSVSRSKSLGKRSLTNADIPESLRREQYREVTSSKLHRVITGKYTVTENYYSTFQKVLFAVVAALGYAVCVAFLALMYSVDKLLLYSGIALPIYALCYLLLYMVLHRSMNTKAPFKMVSLFITPCFLIGMAYMKICELICTVLLYHPAVLFVLFVLPILLGGYNFLIMRKHLNSKHRFLYAVLTALYQSFLTTGYLVLSAFIARFSFAYDALVAPITVLLIYFISYFPVVYTLTRMYAKFTVTFTCIIMLILPFFLLMLGVIMYLSTWMLNLKIEWYISIIACIIATLATLLTFFNYLKSKYVKGFFVFAAIYVAVALVTGLFALMFSNTLPAFPNAEWVWMLLAVVIACALMFLFKLLILKKIIPGIRTAKQNREFLRHAEEQARIRKLRRENEKKKGRR